MKTMLVAAIALVLVTPALAQSYDPDLGPSGNVVPRPYGYSGFGYPSWGYPGYSGSAWGHWGGRGAYARVAPGYRWRHRRGYYRAR